MSTSKEQATEWRKKNPDYQKNWYTKNRLKMQKYRRDWAKNNRESERKTEARYRELNPKIIKAKKRRYYIKYKEEVLKKQYARSKNRYHSDIQFKLGYSLRRRLSSALRRYKIEKKVSHVKLLGCSLEFLVGYLEGKFKDGMTWNNHGKWHIDHIIPLSIFDLTNPEQVAMACHYKNLQPLWAEENISKGGRILSTIKTQ